MEKATRVEKQRLRYEVKIDIHKARKTRERGVGKPRTPRPSPQSMTTLRHKYLQYKRSRPRMTWPP
jgi:hypothetical protein